MPELDYANHLEELYEIASRGEVKPCPGCERERLSLRKPYGRLTLAGTVKVALVCDNGCDIPTYVYAKLNDAGKLEHYERPR